MRRLDGSCDGAEEDEERDEGEKCGHDSLVCIGACGAWVDGREGDLRGLLIAGMEPAGVGGVLRVRLDEGEGQGVRVVENGDAVAEGARGLAGWGGEVGDGEFGTPAIAGRG